MRILLITKRQCVGRDILNDRYWRLFEIPEHLGSIGHIVSGLTLSYRSRPEGAYIFSEPTRTQWTSLNALPIIPLKLWQYQKSLIQQLELFRPDLVWASSDAFHAIAAWWTCFPRRIPFVLDLYDNYESFALTKLPGLTPLLRAACRKAAGLTLISNALKDFVDANYRLPPETPRLVLGNAVDTRKFKVMDKSEARRKLGLPEHGLLVGTAGAIQSNRGIETLLAAYTQLRSGIPDLKLVLAGPTDQRPEQLKQPGVTYLGIIPNDTVPLFWSALDVAIVANKESAFGRYCYPQKLQEIIACGTPVVATGIGEVCNILCHHKHSLVPPDDPALMAEAVASQLKQPTPIDRSLIRTWEDRALELSNFLQKEILHPPRI